ncbi:hypothetical protein D4764_14G0000210 [Takifugu flavidus]|uniref:Secreted protein n=1 Tax=Takifugu flavidus TaxID=433684 RepID=A0A5C6P737_9TELE|nr:hypothetical protein D4764_14G0000210 [Takifugu flavidus]
MALLSFLVSIHPSILCRLFRGRVAGAAALGEKPPDFPLPSHLLQLIGGSPGVPRPVERHSLSNVSWVSPGVSYRRDMP